MSYDRSDPDETDSDSDRIGYITRLHVRKWRWKPTPARIWLRNKQRRVEMDMVRVGAIVAETLGAAVDRECARAALRYKKKIAAAAAAAASPLLLLEAATAASAAALAAPLHPPSGAAPPACWEGMRLIMRL